MQKTRKTTAKMGGLSEERPKNRLRKKKLESKGEQQREMANIVVVVVAVCTAMMSDQPQITSKTGEQEEGQTHTVTK